MKQKITIEIENETGIEFEEVAEWRLVRTGDFYVLLDEEGEGLAPSIIKATVNGCFYAPVLTPKIDHELEEAKRKFPVGSYYTTTERMSGVFAKVESVERVELREENRVCVITSDICSTVESCTPFPLPVWRCCESDKPKRDGTRHVRDKENHSIKGVYQYNLKTETWNGMPILSRNEWLDEGGE